MSEMVKYPVCGMEIEKDSAAGSTEHMGVTIYFCNLGCKEKFESNPENYMSTE